MARNERERERSLGGGERYVCVSIWMVCLYFNRTISPTQQKTEENTKKVTGDIDKCPRGNALIQSLQFLPGGGKVAGLAARTVICPLVFPIAPGSLLKLKLHGYFRVIVFEGHGNAIYPLASNA